jgi:hypothetical protein
MTNDQNPEPLSLSDLSQNKPERPGWSVIFGGMCAEAAAICLEDQGYRNFASLKIGGIQRGEREICWGKSDDIAQRFHADKEVATEYGAYGIAALIIPQLTGLTIIERSIKGREIGFDFWLGSIDDSGPLFQRKARLEVSGIRKGSKSFIQSRVNIKLKQITPSDAVAPAYVCVVEFSTPQLRLVEKCRI